MRTVRLLQANRARRGTAGSRRRRHRCLCRPSPRLEPARRCTLPDADVAAPRQMVPAARAIFSGASAVRSFASTTSVIIWSIGPTRSGKGACYVVPNALTHEGSMIVTDLKGEIFRSTAGYRKSKGNQVFLFAPGSARTHRYNPLDFIRPDRGDRTTDIQNIAAILVPENTELRELDLAGNRPAGDGRRDQLHQRECLLSRATEPRRRSPPSSTAASTFRR